MQQGDIAYSPSDRSRQLVARLLERAIAPDILPVAIQVGEQEVDTAQYIAELADIARNPGALTATDDDHRWSTPH
jgi:cysteine sulfinate desulfinase/cysteine desulfurase-like protein